MKKTCPVCNTIFEPQVAHQNYDRLSCRKKAERQRSRMRDKGMLVQNGTTGRAANATAFNPTEHDLNEFATIYLNNPTAMPMHCRGNVPKDWTPPDGVMFMFQVEMGNEQYYMMCSQAHIEKVEKEREAYRAAHPKRPPNEKIDAFAILDKHFPVTPKVEAVPASAEERKAALFADIGDEN